MTRSELINRLKNSLPGIRAHEEFAPYRKRFENQSETIRKKAAVGVHLYPHKEEWHFLLIERSTYDGNHSAQMAFPGGKPETFDFHLEHTARRESAEELAIPVSSGEKITELSMVWIPVSSFEVSPFVFIHDQRPPISKNEREVAQYHEINLKDLLSEDSVSKRTIQVSKEVNMKDIPCFILNEKIVWGATALILAELKMLLLMD
jgi:8-oxo-dGTP pyrophosphatase MutT (NUDIX family)